MLVLSRRTLESVVVLSAAGIDPMLKVTMLESRGGNVRLGFEAVTDVRIHRWEVWQKILTDDEPPGATIQPVLPVA
jgi:carbon storage regulator CsrA